MAQKNVVKNAKCFIVGHNIAGSTIPYTKEVMNCDVMPATTVFLLLDLAPKTVSLFILFVCVSFKK